MLHLSATAFGGGVAEILYTLVPLMRDAGLDVEWRVIQGQDEFFDVTKTIHNALQGDPTGLTSEQQEIFEAYQLLNAEALEGTYDFVIVHDPQPVGVIACSPSAGTGPGAATSTSRSRIARCSSSCCLDLRPRRRHLPPAPVRAGGRSPADGVDLAAGDRPAGAEEHGALGRRCRLHRRPVRHRRPPPARHAGQPLRPLERPTRRHRGLADRAAVATGAAARPGRLDGARRPGGLGVLQPHGRGGRRGSGHLHPLESEQRRLCRGERVPVHSAAVLQKSIREGFGLTVTEALWKRPVVAGRVGGIVDQLQDGRRLPRLVRGGVRREDEARPRYTRAKPRACSTGQGARSPQHFSPPVARLARISTSWRGTAATWPSWPSPCGPPGRVALWCPQDGGPAQAHRRLQPSVVRLGESGERVARRGEAAAS